MVSTAGRQRYSLRFYNADGRMIDFDNNAVFWVMGRKGDWAGPGAEMLTELNAGGDRGAVSGVQLKMPELAIQCGVTVPEGQYIGDVMEEVQDVMGPRLLTGDANRGWLYYRRYMGRAQPNDFAWRLPCVPTGAPLMETEGPDGDLEYVTEFRFRGTQAVWEADPAQTVTVRAASDATWSTYSWTETPGGNWECFPRWELDGSITSSIALWRIENLTTGQTMELNGMTLFSGQTAVIGTDYQAKFATVGGANAMQYVSGASDFFTLLPGPNSLRVTTDVSNQKAFRLIYRRSRTGVY